MTMVWGHLGLDVPQSLQFQGGPDQNYPYPTLHPARSAKPYSSNWQGCSPLCYLSLSSLASGVAVQQARLRVSPAVRMCHSTIYSLASTDLLCLSSHHVMRPRPCLHPHNRHVHTRGAHRTLQWGELSLHARQPLSLQPPFQALSWRRDAERTLEQRSVMRLVFLEDYSRVKAFGKAV